MSSPSWVTELGLIPSEKGSTPADSFVTVISWNILAEAYTSPRSHPNLPQPYADAIFDTNIRRDLILESLRRLLFLQHDSPSVDVLCLQEVDATLLPTLGPFFQSLGYRFVYAPRAVNESQAKAAPDGCAIVYSSKWNCLASKIVRFDDLADTNRPPLNLQQDDTLVSNYTSTYNPSARAGLMGMTSSYRRRNAALLVHLVSTDSSTSNDSTSVIVGNAHLYWHPGFEYVKLSQAYYLLHHLQQFTQDVRTTHNPAIVLCGDFNSKPESIVYRFITRGTIDATVVAPWKNTTHFYDRDRNSNAPNESVYEDDWKSPSTTTDVDASSSEEDVAMEQSILDPLLCEPYPDTILNESNSSLDEDFDFASLTIHEATSNNNANMSLRIDGNPKYMLDFTLNKLSRWLRILGLDAALETEDEERARTRDGNIILFQKCRQENRILITTSYKLTQRKECPAGTYLITPTNKTLDLETTLVHLLLLHDVTLKPSLFLTRCVVCNGVIVDVPCKEQQALIFTKYGSPNFNHELDVFQCSNCGQGYWWSESPNSSASRVKDLSTQLFVQCLRGGVPIEGPLDFFSFVNVDKERRIGFEERRIAPLQSVKNGGVGGLEEVLSWLKKKALCHSFHFRSAYEENKIGDDGPWLKFTNVTSDFVGILDYVFYDEGLLELAGRLQVPTSFRQLNYRGIPGGHVLPSDIWPSDHLAVGAIFRTKRTPMTVPQDNNHNVCHTISENDNHDAKCVCGCIPPTLSLFEMAELRRLHKLKQTGAGPV